MLTADRPKENLQIEKPVEIPVEIPPKVSRKNLLATGGVAVLIVLASNYLAGKFLERHTSNFGYAVIGRKWQMVNHLTKPVDWLVLGDSTGLYGIDSAALGKSLGGSSVNLCTIGNTLVVGNLALLQRHIARVGPPKHVLLIQAYDVWSRGSDGFVMAKLPISWSELQKANGGKSFSPMRAKWSLARTLPMAIENTSLSSEVFDPAQAPFQQAMDRLQPDGFYRSTTPNPAAIQDELKKRVADLPAHFQISAPNQYALDHLLALADQYNFDVQLLDNPVCIDLGELPAYRSLAEERLKYFKAYAGTHPRLRLAMTAPTLYPASEMENCDHVTVSAAEDFTAKLVRALRSPG